MVIRHTNIVTRWLTPICYIGKSDGRSHFSKHQFPYFIMFKSYLSSRTYCVKCNDCNVPQGSVLGPLMYTTPLCTLISSLSLYHHLYTDDTQLFLSFHPSDFQASITHLQNALTQITSWTTSNLLLLNSSKTEFLLIGLKRQLAKIHNPSTSIDTMLNLLATLASYLINISHSLIRSLHCLNPATITFMLSAVSVPTLTFTPQKQLPPPSYTKLYYCYSLFYGLPKYQINRLQHIQNALAQTVVRAPKFQHITSILKSLHWLKVSEQIEYEVIFLTKFSIPLSHCISMTSYLFSILTVTTHALHLMSLWSNHHHRSKSLIDPFDMLHLIFGTSFLLHSERIPHPNYSSPFQRPSLEHASLTCYTLLSPSITFSLFHSELKLTFSENVIANRTKT